MLAALSWVPILSLLLTVTHLPTFHHPVTWWLTWQPGNMIKWRKMSKMHRQHTSKSSTNNTKCSGWWKSGSKIRPNLTRREMFTSRTIWQIDLCLGVTGNTSVSDSSKLVPSVELDSGSLLVLMLMLIFLLFTRKIQKNTILFLERTAFHLQLLFNDSHSKYKIAKKTPIFGYLDMRVDLRSSA